MATVEELHVEYLARLQGLVAESERRYYEAQRRFAEAHGAVLTAAADLARRQHAVEFYRRAMQPPESEPTEGESLSLSPMAE